MGPPWRIDPTTHRTMNERSYHGATSRSLSTKGVKWKCKGYINHLAKTADPQDCPPPPLHPLMNLFNLNHQSLAKINVLPCQLYQSENLHSLGHVCLKETLVLGIIVRMESSHTSQRQTVAGMLNRGRKLQSMCLVKCHGYEVVCIPC